jgi:hypothetical protein
LDVVDWIHLVQGTDQRPAVANTIVNLGVLQDAAEKRPTIKTTIINSKTVFTKLENY